MAGGEHEAVPVLPGGRRGRGGGSLRRGGPQYRRRRGRRMTGIGFLDSVHGEGAHAERGLLEAFVFIGDSFFSTCSRTA